MNIPLLAATGLMALTTVAHIFGGGPEIYTPIQASDLSEYLRAMSAVIWHGVSVMLITFTGAYLWLLRHPNRALSVQMAVIQFGFAALFLYFGATALGSLIPMPQWSVFLVIPALSFWGERLRS